MKNKPKVHEPMKRHGEYDRSSVDSLLGKRQERTFSIKTRAIDEEKRTVEIAFSSETPVERWYGHEILDHSQGSVRMARLTDGGAVLVNHDSDDHVGVVEKAWIDSDRTGRAEIRFGRSARASEIFQDVVDRIRTKISVGYIPRKTVLESTDDEGFDTYRVTDWEPLENSIVAIPADTAVGVGRSHESIGDTIMTEEEKKALREQVEKETRATINAENAEKQLQAEADKRKADDEKVEHDRIAAEVRKNEVERVRQINEQVEPFPFLREKADEAIKSGMSSDEFNRDAMTQLREKAKGQAGNYSVPDSGRIEMPKLRRYGKLKAFRDTKEDLELAYRAGMWARAVVFGDESARRWCNDHSVRVMTGTTSGTASVVPDEMIQPIINLRESYGVARQRCFIQPMSSDTATVPRRVSGVTAYFPGRTEATPESDATFDDVNLVAREVSALTRVSKAYAADAIIDVGDFITNEMSYAFAVKEDDCLFNGDGTSTYGGIYGIRPKIIDGNHTAGAIDAATGIDTLAEITADDLVSVSGALPDFPGINGAWYTSKRGNALVFDALKAAAGGNTITDLGGSPVKQWLGDEIVISQSMPKVTTDLSNVAMLIYGDLNMGVTFGDRMGIEVDVLTERYAEYRQIGIMATERMDIVVHGLGDTSDAGPVVAMIGE